MTHFAAKGPTSRRRAWSAQVLDGKSSRTVLKRTLLFGGGNDKDFSATVRASSGYTSPQTRASFLGSLCTQEDTLNRHHD